MDQIRNILEAFIDTGLYKGTARRLQVSKNTVREYVRRVKDKCENISEALILPDEVYHIIIQVIVLSVAMTLVGYLTKSSRNFRSSRNKKARQQF